VEKHTQGDQHTQGETHTWRDRSLLQNILLKIIGLFCKRALSNRLYSAKETCNTHMERHTHMEKNTHMERNTYMKRNTLKIDRQMD